MPGRLGRAFLIAALLLAQHAAIAHQLEHVTGAPEPQSTLCESHDLLGTVLGVASGTSALPQLLSLADPRARTPAASAPEARALLPKSRGPPPVS